MTEKTTQWEAAKTSTLTRFDWVTFYTLVGFHAFALLAPFFFSWKNVAGFLVYYVISGFGITVGYHRLLTHKSFQTTKWIQYILTVMGISAFEGGPITWVAQHRQHHLKSDTPEDPHNIKEGFWHAHMGWLFKRFPLWYENQQRETFTPDLLKDPVMCFLEKYNFWIASAIGLTTFYFGGFGMFVWAFCLKQIVFLHATWCVNSAAHVWGYRYWKDELATNNWWVALLTFGEGWHNAHHKFPTSARHGLRWFEFDSSWIVISSLKKMKLAWNIKLPAKSKLPWTAEYAEAQASKQFDSQAQDQQEVDALLFTPAFQE